MIDRRADRFSLAAGIACLLVGAVLGLDQLDAFSLTPGIATAVICAAAGMVLVLSGLDPGPGERGRGGEGDG